MNSEKILNFLFPGDIIEIEVDDIVKNLMNRCGIIINNYIQLEVRGIMYLCNDKKYIVSFYSNSSIEELKNITVTIDLFKSCITYSIDNSSDTYYGSFSGDKSCNFSIFNCKTSLRILNRDILWGERSIKNSYCTNFCSVRNFCRGKDKNCEKNINNDAKSVPLIGDTVRYPRSCIISSPYTVGKVIGLEGLYLRSVIISDEYSNVTELSFSERSVGIDVFTKDKDETKVVKSNHLIIDSNFCKICIKDSCDSCEFKPLKDLDIVWMK